MEIATRRVLILFVLIFTVFTNILIAEQKPKRIAILEFEAKNVSKSYAEIIRDLIEVKLQKSRIFDVLERNQIKMILNEQKFQMSDCSDSICAVQIGKILYADMVIVGSLSKITKYNLSIKIVDVKNGSIMLADTESAETDAELDKAASNIVDRIVRDIQSNNYGAKALTFDNIREKSGNPMDFGVYYRYGFIQNMEVPTIRIPNNYPEPFVISEEKINANLREVLIGPNIGINNYIKLRPTFKFGWGLDGGFSSNSVEINNSSGSKYYATNYAYPDTKFNFHSTGIELSILFNHSFGRLIPFVSVGTGYSYYWDKISYKTQLSNSIDWASPFIYGTDYYEVSMDGSGNIVYSEIEIGFYVFITESIGLSFSGIYNYTIYGNVFQNIKIRKRSSYGDPSQIPTEYQDLDKKINTSNWEDRRFAPIMYLQVGVIYRL